MPIFTENLPLSLYIHLPWCVRKCPYCDFNSHELKGTLKDEEYVKALLSEIDQHLPLINDRPLVSIFLGGGTPSLFSASSINTLMQGIRARMPLHPEIEITMEANPGTLDEEKFYAFRLAGINRLSLGIQSLQDDKLKALGRIHDAERAMMAIQSIKNAGFHNFNLDIMYGLPNQSVDDALFDLRTALSFEPTHFSWYQLTIEPNTFFYHHTPSLPADDVLYDMQLRGQQLLFDKKYQQYEVSAYAKSNQYSKHNYNYWIFGDYLGIGAGAHSKITNIKEGKVLRFMQVKHPRDYLQAEKRQQQQFTELTNDDLIFEFMLNALRLKNGISSALFTKHTGLAFSCVKPLLDQAIEKGLLLPDETNIIPSLLGQQFLNDLQALFLKTVT